MVLRHGFFLGEKTAEHRAEMIGGKRHPSTFCGIAHAVAQRLGMSKQIIGRLDDNSISYLRLKFVEMLELIARYGEHKFRGSCFEQESLAKKVEMALDILLPLHGLERSVLDEEKDKESTGESESDY